MKNQTDSKLTNGDIKLIKWMNYYASGGSFYSGEDEGEISQIAYKKVCGYN